MTGKEVVVAPDAGYWKVRFTDIPLASTLAKRAWKTISGQARGRRNIIDVPIYDTDTAPWPIVDGAPVYAYSDIPHSDTSLFSDGTGYSQPAIDAHLYADFLQGDMELTMALVSGSELEDGMHFS